MDLFGFLLGVGIAIILLLLAFAVLSYVLTAIGLQTLANRNNLDNSWLAWIPIANMYLLGMLVKDKSKVRYIEWILPIGTAAAWIFFGTLAVLISIAVYVLLIMSLYELYKMYSKNYIVLTIFNAIFAFLMPFFLFAIRNYQPINYIDQNDEVTM